MDHSREDSFSLRGRDRVSSRQARVRVFRQARVQVSLRGRDRASRRVRVQALLPDRDLAADQDQDLRRADHRHLFHSRLRAYWQLIPALSGDACSDLFIYGLTIDSSSGHGLYLSGEILLPAGDGPASDGYTSAWTLTGFHHLFATRPYAPFHQLHQARHCFA